MNVCPTSIKKEEKKKKNLMSPLAKREVSERLTSAGNLEDPNGCDYGSPKEAKHGQNEHAKPHWQTAAKFTGGSLNHV
jgi:hypothetical protein